MTSGPCARHRAHRAAERHQRRVAPPRKDGAVTLLDSNGTTVAYSPGTADVDARTDATIWSVNASDTNTRWTNQPTWKTKEGAATAG